MIMILMKHDEVFDRQKFENDLEEFVDLFLDAYPELAPLLQQLPDEVRKETREVCIQGIRAAVYESLAQQLSCPPKEVPDGCAYHFGTFYCDLRIIEPVESRLLNNPVVVKYLQDTDFREVYCSQVAHLIDDEYRGHIMVPRTPDLTPYLKD